LAQKKPKPISFEQTAQTGCGDLLEVARKARNCTNLQKPSSTKSIAPEHADSVTTRRHGSKKSATPLRHLYQSSDQFARRSNSPLLRDWCKTHFPMFVIHPHMSVIGTF